MNAKTFLAILYALLLSGQATGDDIVEAAKIVQQRSASSNVVSQVTWDNQGNTVSSDSVQALSTVDLTKEEMEDAINLNVADLKGDEVGLTPNVLYKLPDAPYYMYNHDDNDDDLEDGIVQQYSVSGMYLCKYTFGKIYLSNLKNGCYVRVIQGDWRITKE